MKIRKESKVIDVYLADSIFKKFMGMRFKREGKMLFRFRNERRRYIDMLMVFTKLHLYFMDSRGVIIEKEEAEPWGFDPRTWNLYCSNEPYQYLLESDEELGLEIGDKLDLEG